MSEVGERDPRYKDGDIVWVKLGSCWWPGEVTEKGPEDYTAKKPPIAIVKFFNEDSYEFVKNDTQIYEYNCERKNEFIRKGMDSYRANNSHMTKFPGDVSHAEIRTNGNPNIINDPIFSPIKKTNIVAEIFGSPNQNKTKKLGKGRPSKGTPKKQKVTITHRRFLGCDDYEAHIRVQYPGKDNENVSGDEEILRQNTEPSKTIDCSLCNFSTKNVEVMLVHVQCHISGIESSVKKSPKKKKKKKLFKHITSDDDDLTNSSVGRIESSEDEAETKKKRKKKAPTVKKPKKKKIEREEKTVPEPEKTVTDIKTNLLAEWSDDDELEDEEIKEVEAIKTVEKAEPKVEESKKVEDKIAEPKKSCFDFDEDEELSLVQTAVGRKIPRVIPPTEKRKSTESVEDASLPIAEDDENRIEILKTTEPELDKQDEFQSLMEETAVPELPDLPSKKSPEKVVATKLTNPKKRFVKSFEDFELLQNEQRKAQEEEMKKAEEKKSEDMDFEEKKEEEDEEKKIEEEAEDLKNDELSNLHIAKLKCQIMSKLSDDEPEVTKTGTRKSHRTPRSKILESYEQDKLKDETPKKEEKGKRFDKKQQKKEKSEEKKIEETAIEDKQEDEKEEDKVEIESEQEKAEETEEAIEETHKEEKVVEEVPIEEVPEEKVEAPITELEKEDVPPITEPTNPVVVPEPEVEPAEEPEEKLPIEPQPQTEEPPKEEEETKIEPPKPVTIEEEMDKVPIDDYINDFLFDISKPKPEEETTNEVHIKCAGDEQSDLDFAIKTNLSNLNKDDDSSGLSTLAMIAEFEKTEEEKEEIKLPFQEKPEAEMVPIDGNLTVVSEKDLADGQVEISASVSKPVTLTNFSMDFSDSNSTNDDEKKIEEDKKLPLTDEICDLEEHIPSQIVDKKVKDEIVAKLEKTNEVKVLNKEQKKVKTPLTPKIVKPPTPQSNKPIILSEKIIKPIKTDSSVSVQKITNKRNLHDPDEIDTFIIQKSEKKPEPVEEPEVPAKKLKKTVDNKVQSSANPTPVKKRGKAKILQQTIIRPAGEIIPTSQSDDNVFDINSMPIVLSDQILTPESIENMPIYLGESETTPTTVSNVVAKVQTTIVKKTVPVTTPTQMRVINKSVATPVQKIIKTPKILGSMGNKILKQNSFAPGASTKHGKYVIVTQAAQASPVSTPSKYTVGKKQVVKRVDSGVTKMVEPSGNKIMILTDQQGQQQRVLLTPAQQKMMGYGTAGKTKTLVKGNIIQKTKEGTSPIAGSSGLITRTVTPSRLNSSQTLITSSGQVLQTKSVTKHLTPTRKLQTQSHKTPLKPPQQKTILIKNQHGQTVRKIQGTDDALLDKQVAEQIEAIKQQQKASALQKSGFRRSYVKKVEPVKQVVQKVPKEPVIPPLAPISPQKKVEEKGERALHQLVIQDAMGNQTTITEGQILALPSETVDGQPQSYMLVTLDESGNLTPLNNEALLSLDPNLGLGGDLSNTVLQLDQSALKEETVVKEVEPQKIEEEVKVTTQSQETTDTTSAVQSLNDSGQQLIVTGDPIAAQKFLESLTEGNTDLANILASAEGSSFLIHADGQQILINTDSDNQMLLSVNTDNLNMTESTEGGGNPIFATQPKNQDILAAALADTDVFQQEQNGNQNKVSQLSPNSTLYPMNVGNVLETSLTLNSPIMTPLEVPSTKKISDESDILQVPKNVDLPITITDPNISQTVSQQHVALTELQTNLELSLPISETTVTTEMNSPSFVYSLPNLETSEITLQKPFNSSMPLLTEDSEEVPPSDPTDDKKLPNSFLEESEGLCTLGGEMCSSLSEPPPDMFDLSAVLSSHQLKSASEANGELKIDEATSVTETSSPVTTNEDSCEIPVQPVIVATLPDEKSGEEDKCKFDD